MKSGFSLIELVAALLIASLISLSLFQLLTQTRKAVGRITNIIQLDEPFMAFYHQLEKDITGMFAPLSSVDAYAEKEKKKKKKVEEVRAQDKKQPEKKDEEEQEPQKEEKPIKDVFVLNAQQDAFFWSFITTGAISLLESDGTEVAMSYLRRVAYMLEKDPQRPDVFRLMYRFSGENLDVETFKKAEFEHSYELISGIKHFAMELTLFQQPEKKEDKAETGKPEAGKMQAEKKAPPQATTVKEWREEEMWEKYKTLIPAYVRLRGTVVDKTKREYPFEFMFKVYAYSPYKEKEKEKTLFEAIEDIASKIFKTPNAAQGAKR